MVFVFQTINESVIHSVQFISCPVNTYTSRTFIFPNYG